MRAQRHPQAQLPPHRYSATRDIHALKIYLEDEAPNTALFARLGSRNKFKLSADDSGASARRNPISRDEATKAFCTLMTSMLHNYVNDTNPDVLQAVNCIQNLCGPPYVPGSIVTNSPELRAAVKVLAEAAPPVVQEFGRRGLHLPHPRRNADYKRY
jgi:hypothetical protein